MRSKIFIVILLAWAGVMGLSMAQQDLRQGAGETKGEARAPARH